MISSVIIAIRIIQPIHFLLACFQTPIDLNRTGGHADIQKDPLITMIPAVYFSFKLINGTGKSIRINNRFLCF